MSNKEILRGVLEKVIDIKINEIVEVVPGRELFEISDSHKIIPDIYAKDDLGRVYIVENQNYEMKSFINRLEYYAQLLSVDSYKTKEYPNKREAYSNLPEAFCIWICYKNPFKDKNGIVNCTKVARESNISMYHHQRQIVLSRDCINEIEDKDIRAFLLLFDETTRGNTLHSSWYVLELIYKEYQRIKHSKESEGQYMKDYFDEMHLIETGYAQGITHGITQGISQGITQGIAEGELRKQYETIVNMYRKDFDVDTIAEIVNCSVDEVKKVIDALVVA